MTLKFRRARVQPSKVSNFPTHFIYFSNAYSIMSFRLKNTLLTAFGLVSPNYSFPNLGSSSILMSTSFQNWVNVDLVLFKVYYELQVL